MLLCISVVSMFSFIAKKYSITSIQQSLIIHNPIDGHLGWQSLAAMINAAVNIPVEVFLCSYISFHLGKYLVLELLSHRLGIY